MLSVKLIIRSKCRVWNWRSRNDRGTLSSTPNQEYRLTVILCKILVEIKYPGKYYYAVYTRNTINAKQLRELIEISIYSLDKFMLRKIWQTVNIYTLTIFKY